MRRTVTLAPLDVPSASTGGDAGQQSGGKMRTQPQRSSRRQSPYGRSPSRFSPAPPTTGLSAAMGGVALASAKGGPYRRFPPRLATCAAPILQGDPSAPRAIGPITRLIEREKKAVAAIHAFGELERKREAAERAQENDAQAVGYKSVHEWRDAAVEEFRRQPPARPASSPARTTDKGKCTTGEISLPEVPIRRAQSRAALKRPERLSSASEPAPLHSSMHGSSSMSTLHQLPPRRPRLPVVHTAVPIRLPEVQKHKVRLKPEYEWLASP